MQINILFSIESAKSKGTDDYSPGEIPFVTNTEFNNGIVSHVDALDGDKIFEGPAICISGLGYATVHFDKFLPKGNGGDSCTILKPKIPMKNQELIYYAALFNTSHGWRFSFGRKANESRISKLQITPVFAKSPINSGKILNETNLMIADLVKTKEQKLLS
jgi:hypothetical protein